MGTIIAWIVVGILAVIGVVVWWRFSLRRRLDSHMHTGTTEERQVYSDIQRDIDRGKSAAQGFFPM